ncbi:class I SAM-dependent methyltransferase [Paucisalibacillus sp. EB02]|uniref:class I SAM-dependent methyltransferase n=1 Tax=Paucisalibacillus sp. EB02 TaxID=1347087 RepID=UPI0005AA0947|nr:methyltransferase domain-containing protein [Paucisalibacillus sp. EB02]
MIDPSKHPDWLQPHSVEWYQHIGEHDGKYLYPWNSILDEPNGETIFDKEVLRMVEDKNVLDVGCGHGDFTIRCSTVAEKVTGFDITEQFIGSGRNQRMKNVSFVLGNTKDALPFERDEFDCAYIRKGPTSAYPLLSHVVKPGGRIIGLHPGDESGKELLRLFPDMFQQPTRKVMDVLTNRLKNSSFSRAEIESINSVEYLQSPIDVVKMCCFGQKDTVYKMVEEQKINQITETFHALATNKGFAVTFSRYIIRIEV